MRRVSGGSRPQKSEPLGFGAGDQRCTPPEVWRVALAALGLDEFDLDPATNEFATVPAKKRLMGGGQGAKPEDNGLLVAWSGHVWLNFPFSTPMPWVECAVKHAAARRVTTITVLGPISPDTRWHRLLVRNADARADWPRRYHFPTASHPKGQAMGGFALYFFGAHSTEWRRHMAELGCTTYAGVL